jgi:Flp pilus assembly pilin Flp
MKAQVITTEYTGLCPVQPWQHVVAASQGSAMDAEAAAAMAIVPAGFAETAADAPRKAADRGASAVEWVVITGIVVAIVAGVGWGISKAISGKADQACNQINNAGNNVDVTGGGNGGGNSGGSTTTGGSGGCGK